MQSNLFQRTNLSAILAGYRKGAIQVTQVRNHSKIYPWRSNRSNSECYLDSSKTDYTDKLNINEFMKGKRKKKAWMQVIPKDKDNRFNSYKWNEAYKSDPKEAKETARNRMKMLSDSLLARGSARESQGYDPPEGVRERIVALYRGSQLEDPDVLSDKIENDDQILDRDLNQNRALKFNLISRCVKEFSHDLPGSYLNDISQIRDLVEYFSTPVRGINPYSALLNKDNSLPTNLHLIAEPTRFDKDTDKFFEGYNAMPGLVSKMSGLRGSKKYPTLNQDEFQWPDI